MRTFPDADAEETLPDRCLRWAIVAVEYAIVASLLLVAGVVLVRTVVEFLRHQGSFAGVVINAIDGILVVVILLDIAHTVFGRLRSASFPVRPFLEIGVLAGVRDILSASAHLTIGGRLSERDFSNTLISVGVGVGVVVLLLVGLNLLRMSLAGTSDAADTASGDQRAQRDAN